MKTRFLLPVLGIGLAALVGCKTLPPPAPIPVVTNPEDRAKMQTNIYTGKYDVAFASTLAVLQDLAWRLESVDKAAGIIRATTARHTEALGPNDEQTTDLKTRQQVIGRHTDVTQKWSRWTELVIHTEPWGTDQVRQRIVMSLRGTLPPMSYSEEQGGTAFTRGRAVTIHAPAEEQSVEVSVPEAYGDLFERIEKAIRVRQGM